MLSNSEQKQSARGAPCDNKNIAQTTVGTQVQVALVINWCWIELPSSRLSHLFCKLEMYKGCEDDNAFCYYYDYFC